MSLTVAEITALIVGIGGVVTALGVSITNIIMALNESKKRRRDSVRVRRSNIRLDKKLNNVITSTAVIEGHVNSQATKASEENKALEDKLSFVAKLLEKQEQVAVRLAEAAAKNEKLWADRTVTDK